MGDDEVDRTLWCGNLSPDVTEEILYELFLQAGPLESVSRQAGKQFAFIRFKHAVSVPYTIELMSGIILFNKRINLQSRPGSCHEQNERRGYVNERDDSSRRNGHRTSNDRSRFESQDGGNKMGSPNVSQGAVSSPNQQGTHNSFVSLQSPDSMFMGPPVYGQNMSEIEYMAQRQRLIEQQQLMVQLQAIQSLQQQQQAFGAQQAPINPFIPQSHFVQSTWHGGGQQFYRQ